MQATRLVVGCCLSLCACSSRGTSPATRAAPAQAGSLSSVAAAGSGGSSAAANAPAAGSGGSVSGPSTLLPPPTVPPCAGSCGAPARTPDNDGFSVADGDCDDFAELVNPGAYDIPGNGIDEDCQDGDAPTADCDAALDVADADPLAAARAIELCPVTDETSKRWGVISARWTTPDGKGEPGGDMMHGLLPGLGPSFTPRGGKTLLALSSGVARAPGQPGATHDCSDSFPADSHLPAGFDRTSSTCELTWEDTTVVDAIALELRVRMPTNVQAFGFDSAFFTDEYPDFICSPFNDFFQVIVEPMRKGGSRDGNVLFDQDGNAVSVNNSLLRVCSPGQHGGKDFDCPLGFMPLVGTGFEDCAPSGLTPGGLFGDLFGDSEYGASTGWVNTELAVTPGEIITLRFTIWDSGDSALDSLALIDHVQFRFRDAPPPPEMPMTTPINPD